MGTRNRRIRDKRRAATRQRSSERHDAAELEVDVGRTRLVRFVYTLSCPGCGYSDAGDMVMSSAAPAGSKVEITTSCTCGGQTHGTARVLEVFDGRTDFRHQRLARTAAVGHSAEVNKPTDRYIGPSDTEIRAELLAGLAQWSTFPIGDDPRPMLLLSDAFNLAGFTSVDTKKAFERTVEVDPSLPPVVLEALRLAGAYNGDGSRSPVRVVDARESDREFSTDRGLRRLPVWELDMTNTIGPGHVMTAEWQRKAWAPHIAASRSGMGTRGHASVSADGRTVAFTFPGRPACYASYPRALVEESDHAVAIYPIPQDHPNAPEVRLQYLETRTVGVTLSQPLGDRVLLGFGTRPVSVTESSSDA